MRRRVPRCRRPANRAGELLVEDLAACRRILGKAAGGDLPGLIFASFRIGKQNGGKSGGRELTFPVPLCKVA